MLTNNDLILYDFKRKVYCRLDINYEIHVHVRSLMIHAGNYEGSDHCRNTPHESPPPLPQIIIAKKKKTNIFRYVKIPRCSRDVYILTLVYTFLDVGCLIYNYIHFVFFLKKKRSKFEF